VSCFSNSGAFSFLSSLSWWQIAPWFIFIHCASFASLIL
jgi:hypothetical protein